MNRVLRTLLVLGGLSLWAISKYTADLLSSSIVEGNISMAYSVLHPAAAFAAVALVYLALEGLVFGKRGVFA